jgi:hypothetical protein
MPDEHRVEMVEGDELEIDLADERRTIRVGEPAIAVPPTPS